MTTASEGFFASCPRGLEAPLAEEIGAAGGHDIGIVAGGVRFSGDWRACYAANLESRLATRVLWRVGEGRYRSEDDVYRLARRLDWPAWFDVARTLRVYVAAIKSPLKSLEFITLRIKDAVCDRFRDACGGRRPSVDTADPEVRIHAFLTADSVTFYLDTSGEALYLRGLKHAKVQAPLKENLAAGILRLAGWSPGMALLDPMCGSGTFLLEAAQTALAIARSQQNLAAAGLDGVANLARGDILELDPPAPSGVLVANPPYGERIGEADELALFYPRLGDALKSRYAGWDCHFLSSDTRLAKLIGLRADHKTPLYNGALECRLYHFRMVSGPRR